PFEIDTWRDHQPVVRNAGAACDRYLLFVTIDCTSHDIDDVDPTFAHLVVVMPQRFYVAKTSDIEIREEAGRKIFQRFDQRHIDGASRILGNVAGNRGATRSAADDDQSRLGLTKNSWRE